MVPQGVRVGHHLNHLEAFQEVVRLLALLLSLSDLTPSDGCLKLPAHNNVGPWVHRCVFIGDSHRDCTTQSS